MFIKYCLCLLIFIKGVILCNGEEKILGLSTDNIANSDITLSKSIPKEKDKVTIKARLHNLGKEAVKNVAVSFFLGDPDKGGKLIGSPRTISEIMGQGAATSSVEWDADKNGLYSIWVSALSKSPPCKATASLEVPVVVKDLYFWTWGMTVKDARYVNNTITVTGKTKEEQEEARDYWRNRGCIPLLYKTGVSRKGQSEEDFVNYWSSADKEGFPGILLDEIGCFPGTEPEDKASEQYAAILLKALRKVKKETPKLFLAVCNAGNLNPVECAGYREGADLVLLEIYINYFRAFFKTHSFYKYFDHRIEMARNLDLLDKSIVILSIDKLFGASTFSEIEEQVRYVVKTAPEMPGIAFWGGGASREWADKTGLPRFCDQLALKYYIKPVLMLKQEDITFSNYQPKVGEKTTVSVMVHNIGGMDANDIEIKFYNETDGKKGLIGSRKIKILPAGQKIVDKDRYPMGQEMVNIDWEPQNNGYQNIIVEIDPPKGMTVLDGRLGKMICVDPS